MSSSACYIVHTGECSYNYYAMFWVHGPIGPSAARPRLYHYTNVFVSFGWLGYFGWA